MRRATALSNALEFCFAYMVVVIVVVVVVVVEGAFGVTDPRRCGARLERNVRHSKTNPVQS